MGFVFTVAFCMYNADASHSEYQAKNLQCTEVSVGLKRLFKSK